ncbi:37S ribosomal protein S25 [Apiospora hydei]|uniref:Small ribosomal subunit protein mS23 n=1 Tax=Apiospora hydei TaxID=1337664 RepID=A0ABR1XC72_9PEZI
MVRGPAQRQIRPARVYQTVTTLMEHRIKPRLAVQQPVWYKVVESIPPSEILTRPFPPQHRQPNPRARKASRLFQPQKLVYKEDELRKKFYTDHPWELARPRMIIEMDGKDAPPLVVQRQMYLMENVPGITEDTAYDQVRKEFYKLRQEEEIERRIAQEEARMVGAYFGQTFNQVGMKLEDQQFERWKRWATREIEKIQGEQTAAYSSFDASEDPEAADLDVDSLREDLESTANIPPA